MADSIDRLAGRQHGLATTAQLQEVGLTRRQVQVRTRRGEFIVERPGVLRLRGVPPTRGQAWLAAILAAGHEAWLSHCSAARLHRFPGYPDPESIDVLLLAPSQLRLPGVTCHRTIWLPRNHRTTVSRIPATTVERTLIDSCSLVSESMFERTADRLLREKRASLPKLVQCAEDVPVSGRRAIRPIRSFLASYIPGFELAANPGERSVLEVIARAGLPLPKQQFRVTVEGHTYFLDYAYPDTKQALEYEGFDPHGTMVTQFHRDRDRARRLQRAGWTIWPLTARTSEAEIIAVAMDASGMT